MKRIVCVNIDIIIFIGWVDKRKRRYHGTGLILKEIYTSTGVVKNDAGLDCYFIEELNSRKLCSRFRDVDSSFGESIIDQIEEESNYEKVI